MARRNNDRDFPLRDALGSARRPRPGPTAPQADKKNYAERLSRQLAIFMGQALRPHFPMVTPTLAGQEQEAQVGGDGGKKRLDVKVWDDKLGLLLNLSIKTYSFRDYSPKTGKFGRFTKNVLRNDHELRAEADVIHKRQPFSVLVAVVFMNADAARDGVKSQSSFAHAVFTFRKRSGRRLPDGPRFDRFERVFIGLFEPDGEQWGRTSFFDVEWPPPRNGLPQRTIDLATLISEITTTVGERNEVAADYEDGSTLDVDDDTEINGDE